MTAAEVSNTAEAVYMVTPPVTASAAATAREWCASMLDIPSSRKTAKTASSSSRGSVRLLLAQHHLKQVRRLLAQADGEKFADRIRRHFGVVREVDGVGLAVAARAARRAVIQV